MSSTIDEDDAIALVKRIHTVFEGANKGDIFIALTLVIHELLLSAPPSIRQALRDRFYDGLRKLEEDKP